jgi:CRP-like cAMP-binding protein
MSEQRLFLLRRQTTEERYQSFLEMYPGLIQRIPLKYIATFLGMNTETLSRLRKKLSRKQQILTKNKA